MCENLVHHVLATFFSMTRTEADYFTTNPTGDDETRCNDGSVPSFYFKVLICSPVITQFLALAVDSIRRVSSDVSWSHHDWRIHDWFYILVRRRGNFDRYFVNFRCAVFVYFWRRRGSCFQRNYFYYANCNYVVPLLRIMRIRRKPYYKYVVIMTTWLFLAKLLRGL